MAVSRVYAWSLSNQIESDAHRTLPSDISSLGQFVLRCWFDVGGGGGSANQEDSSKKRDLPDNGVGRLIMRFAFGFKTTSSHALIGMPCEGKVGDTLTRCTN